MPQDARALVSTVTAAGALRLSLMPQSLPDPGPGELLVRVEAAPVNPSDLGLIFGPADMATLAAAGTPEAPLLVARIPPAAMPALAARIDQPLPLGNEGAGTVIAAGPDQQALIGRRVAMIGGGMYASHRLIAAEACLVLPEGTTAEAGAALFVNPLTALGFVETLRASGHQAMVHAPAASNLGQMLVRICAADGIPLVNIVRSPAQVALLRGIGATHVVDSSAPDFAAALDAALEATGATLLFDAIGGGGLTSTVLNAMEAVALRSRSGYDRYGSGRFKQGYIYGALDTGPTVLARGFGFSWSVGGWLLFPFLQQNPPEVTARLKARVLAEMHTTFASAYSARVSLEGLCDPDVAAASQRKATGAKLLLTP